MYRLRRGLFGYRREDVHAALADQRAQIGRIASSLDTVWRDRDSLSAELTDERARFQRELEAERERVSRLERRARLRALHVIGRAEKEASRLRRDTKVFETQASSRIEELLEVREHLLDDLHARVVAVADALDGTPDAAARERSTNGTRRRPFNRRAVMTQLDLDWRFTPSSEGAARAPRLAFGGTAAR